MEVVETMAPPPWASIKGRAAREQAKTERAFRSTMSS
jgi:hypothetical protein